MTKIQYNTACQELNNLLFLSLKIGNTDFVQEPGGLVTPSIIMPDSQTHYITKVISGTKNKITDTALFKPLKNATEP